jgi:Protein of unknown function (DUF2442)
MITQLPKGPIKQAMPIELSTVHALPNSELRLVMTSGEQRLFDVKPYLDKGVFRDLQDHHYFAQVKCAPDYLYWPKGQDLSLDTVVARSTAITMQVNPKIYS